MRTKLSQHMLTTCVVAGVGLGSDRLTAAPIYWVDGVGLHKMSIDGENHTLVLTGIGIFAFHPRAGHIFFQSGACASTCVETINRSAANGSGSQVIVEDASVRGIAVDSVNSKVVWLHPGAGGVREIRRANLDGTNVETIADISASVLWPADLEIDELNGKIYWLWNSQDTSPGGIGRCNLDGSNREDHFLALDGYPWGLSLVPDAGELYVIGEIGVFRADLDGAGLQQVFTLPGSFYPDIAVDHAGGKIYWTSFYDKKVERANLDGSERETFAETSVSPWTVRLEPPQFLPSTSWKGLLALASGIALVGSLSCYRITRAQSKGLH